MGTVVENPRPISDLGIEYVRPEDSGVLEPSRIRASSHAAARLDISSTCALTQTSHSGAFVIEARRCESATDDHKPTNNETIWIAFPERLPLSFALPPFPLSSTSFLPLPTTQYVAFGFPRSFLSFAECGGSINTYSTQLLGFCTLLILKFPFFQVNVGEEGSFYDPPTTDALEGDVIHFVFGGLWVSVHIQCT